MKENEIKKITVFDKRDIYDSVIGPKVADLKLFCQVNKIPMFFAAAVRNDEEGTEYRRALIYAGIGARLKDKSLGRAIFAAFSFKSAPPANVRRAVKEILDYAQSLDIGEGDPVFLEDVVLTEDLISRLKTVVDGWGDGLVVPGKGPVEESDVDDGVFGMY